MLLRVRGMCEWQYAYAKYFGFAVSVMFSERRCLFFFSQVQSFKYGSANLFRSECVDAESKGDDGFKTVNLHAAFVRQFDGMLCLIFPSKHRFYKEPLSLLGLLGR